MAPVETYSNASRTPMLIAITHIFLVVWLSTLAGRTLYRSKLALTPSSATRHREPLRKGHVKTFSILAGLSLLAAFFYSVTYAGLSYRTWAAERGVELPQGYFGEKGGFRAGEHPGRVHVTRWLSDTPFYRDALEIVSKEARYSWWGQQINLGLVSWSLFLAVEGQRRKISNLWVFLALSQLVNLSYAQNLFFVAILLTPVPLPENVKDITRGEMGISSSRFSRLKEKLVPANPEGFVPRTALYITLLLFNYAAIFLLPFASNTPSFPTITILSRILPFAFLALPYITPEFLGTVNTSPHSSYATYTTIFRAISAISFILHCKTTGLALFYATPEEYTYHHSLLQPFTTERLSAPRQAGTAVSRLLGAIAEHPAVSAVGADAILTGLSLGVWAAVRGLDAREMLGATVPFAGTVAKELEAIEGAHKDARESVQSDPISPSRRRSGRPRKAETPNADSTATSALTPKRSTRNRSSKTKVTKEDAYQPEESQVEEGDKDVEEDWESAALAWGGIAVGGLGVGSAGVYGGEVRAR